MYKTLDSFKTRFKYNPVDLLHSHCFLNEYIDCIDISSALQIKHRI